MELLLSLHVGIPLVCNLLGKPLFWLVMDAICFDVR